MGLDPRGQNPNYAARRELAKVREQQNRVKEQNMEIINRELSGAEQAEMDRIAAGGVDYSLFNLIMSRVDMRLRLPEGSTLMDAMRVAYDVQWPYMAKLIKENNFMRGLVELIDIDEEGKQSLSRDVTLAEIERMKEIYATEVDPKVGATMTLIELKKLAKKRSKLNLY